MCDCPQQRQDCFIGGGLTEGAEKSVFFRLDARVKIIASFSWSILLASLHNLKAASLGLLISVLLIVFARWPWRDLIKRVFVVNVFIIFMWFMLPFSFSSPGHVIADFGWLKVTEEGLNLALLLTVKANGILLAIIALLCSSHLFVLAAAGQKLGVPEKLTSLFLLTVRYFEVIFQEYKRLRIAMRARGFENRLNMHTCRSFANLIGSLLVRSLDRADMVHRAMLCRGYTGSIWVKSAFHFTVRETIFAACVLISMLLVGGVEWIAKP